MFGDVKLSREKMADFRAQLAAAGRHPEVDMSVQVREHWCCVGWCGMCAVGVRCGNVQGALAL